MSERFDISAPRKKKDGGTYWVKIGTAWQSDKGIQLVFDALPLPDSEGRCVANLFEPRERRTPDGPHATGERKSGYHDSPLPSPSELDDEIPF